MTGTSESEQALRRIARPACGVTGSIRLGEVLAARPLGTWSLAGSQLKVSAVRTPALVCGTAGCSFHKLPSERKEGA